MSADRLLAALLAGQPQPNTLFDDAAFASAVHHSLTSGVPLANADAMQIWLHPEARELYATIRTDLTRRAKRQWVGRGLDLSAERLAAASDDGESGVAEEIRARGFTVTTHQNKGDGRWLVSLLIEPEIASELPAGISVALSDSGGLGWLSGPLDRLGGIDAWWPHNESPRQRLAVHQLLIDFA
ncbi:hypothetical protein [Sandarakinorhabdus sp.]|uniref:hypothetical protein n=1 Tax=Sandarakinorhabdus sp. TaxID=1916663 RepID=UPI003F7047EF